MSELTEREQYVSKLGSQIIGMNQLLNPKFHEVISNSTIDKILELQRKSDKLKTKLEKNEFEIAIIGLEKAGKSTFANALMGNDILPSMDARCTYTSTCIKYGTEDYAEIIFFTHEEFQEKFISNLSKMKIPHAENLDYTSLSLDSYRRMFEELPEDTKELYRISINEDVENILKNSSNLSKYIDQPVKTYRGADILASEEFKNFIQHPAYAVAVKEITIHSSKLEGMKNAVLYDVPGFDSPTKIHEEQTIKMMRSTDVIVLIANASKPSLTGPQLKIFEGKTDEDGIPFNEKVFVFANKADMANTSLDENIRHLKNDLDKYRIVKHDWIDSRLVVGSARAKLEEENKLTGNANDILKSKGITNGIDEIRDMLVRYNETERFNTLKKRANRINSELEECLNPELKLQSGFSDYSADTVKMNEISFDLLSRSGRISRRLGSLKTEISRKFQTELPLSKEFERIIQSINSQNYGVTEEEQEEAYNSAGTTTTQISTDKFESELRQNKYTQIYKFFIEKIIELANGTHEEYDKQIIQLFEEELSVSPSNPYYDEVNENINEYLSKINPENKEGYYRSLAERFSTDLLETLIRATFGGRDRWAQFTARKLNLYMLSIFHKEYDNTVPNNKQPMLYSILFHHNISTDNLKSSEPKSDNCTLTVEDLKKCIRNYKPECTEVQLEMIETTLGDVLEEKKNSAVEFVKATCAEVTKPNPSMFVSSLSIKLRNNLNNENASTVSAPFATNISVPDITQEYYDETCLAEKLRSSDDDVVCKNLNTDIDILGNILLKSTIPAIQIDNAFKFYEIRSIENILESLRLEGEHSEFRDFISKNSYKIACDRYKDMEAEQKKNRLRQQICGDIAQILEDINKK